MVSLAIERTRSLNVLVVLCFFILVLVRVKPIVILHPPGNKAPFHAVIAVGIVIDGSGAVRVGLHREPSQRFSLLAFGTEFGLHT